MSVSLVADTLNIDSGTRFSTFLIHDFPKCLLAELNTHRQLVRNTASTRAIPNKKYIEKAREKEYIPTWTRNQPGMVGMEDDTLDTSSLTKIWNALFEQAISTSEYLTYLGAHKQEANRVLDAFIRIPVLLSGTEWENFLKLRTDSSTAPDFQSIAKEIERSLAYSTPKHLSPGEYHIPFSDKMPKGMDTLTKLKIAVARCARISYYNHIGEIDVEKDLALFQRLLDCSHLSCFEHIAYVAPAGRYGIAYYTSDRDAEVEPMPNNLTNNFSYLSLDGITPKQHVWTRQYSNFYTLRHIIEDGLFI